MITIAPFRLSHLKRILAIERACFPNEPYHEDLFRHYHARCGELFFVAKCLGRIAGYMITCIDNGSAEIISIAVHPRWQRKGLGRRLMEHTLARVEHLEQITLMVRETSEPAIRLYQAFGFRLTGVVNQYYADGANGIRMTKLT